jgi:TRAP-type C4-dicarboxylate transport system permease small subunit
METEKQRNEKIFHPEPGKLGRIVRRIEEILFSVIVFTMIILGLTPIIMRFSGMSGVVWIGPMTRYFVLLIALLGAGTAVRERSSISVDIVSHLISDRKRLILRSITEIVSAVVCGAFTWISIYFVMDFERDIIVFFRIPEWWLTMILPCGFFLLVLRLLIAAWEDFMIALKLDGLKVPSEEEMP